MKIAVTGATGLVGGRLVPALRAAGHDVVRLTRGPVSGEDTAQWDPDAGRLDAGVLEGAGAVVHLAGEPIASGRWTQKQKRRILDSRVDGTRLIAETAAKLVREGRPGPRVLAVASAIGYYGDRDDEVLTESSPPGEGFLPQVCVAWEAAADPAREAGLRVVHLRTGIALAPGGGALKPLLIQFKLGLGGRFGRGDQWWSWVGIHDVVGAYTRAVEDDGLEGAVNLTGPAPVTNREFTKTLARVLRRPAVVPVPKFGPKLVLGELADSLLFDSARILPTKLEQAGYHFRHRELEPCLRDILDRPAR